MNEREAMAELERLRKLAHRSESLVFDNANGQLLVVVRTVGGVVMPNPEVVSIPLGDMFMFMAQAIMNMPHIFGKPMITAQVQAPLLGGPKLLKGD